MVPSLLDCSTSAEMHGVEYINRVPLFAYRGCVLALAFKDVHERLRNIRGN